MSEQAPGQPPGPSNQQPASSQPTKRTRLTSSRQQQQTSQQADAAPPKFTALATRQQPRRHDGNSPAPRKAKALPPAHSLRALPCPSDLQNAPKGPSASTVLPPDVPLPSAAIQQTGSAPFADEAGPSSSPSALGASSPAILADHAAAPLGNVPGSKPTAIFNLPASGPSSVDVERVTAVSQPPTAAAATSAPAIQLDDAAVAEAHVHLPTAQGDGASAELDLEQRLETPAAVQPYAASAAAPVTAAAVPQNRAPDAENVPQSRHVPAGQTSGLGRQQLQPSASIGQAGVGSGGTRALQSQQAASDGDAPGPSGTSEDVAGRAGARKAGQPLAELSAAPSEDSQKSSADVSAAVHDLCCICMATLATQEAQLTVRLCSAQVRSGCGGTGDGV